MLLFTVFQTLSVVGAKASFLCVNTGCIQSVKLLISFNDNV